MAEVDMAQNMDVNVGCKNAKVLTIDASGAQYKHTFSRQGDELELQDRFKSRPTEGEIPNWKRVAPKVTGTVREELESRGYDVV